MSTRSSFPVPELVSIPVDGPIPVTAMWTEPRRVASSELLQGAQELLIEHQGACYRLRLTAQGRLILTK